MRHLNMMKKPDEIAFTIREAGRKKTQLSKDRMFILAILAGVYIGFGAHLATTISMDMVSRFGVGITNLASGAAFSVGLMLVILGGAELFTGNNLIWLSYLSRRTSPSRILKSWITVYLGNLVGALLLVFLIFYGRLFQLAGGTLGLRAISIANAKVNLSFAEAICRGIVCNWLVCLAVWIAASAEDTTGKILACFFPIMAFVASGFEHSIANMFFVPMGILLKNASAIVSLTKLDLTNLTWVGFVLKNLIPVTFGNIIGGSFFVATFYWYVYLRPAARAFDILAELNEEKQHSKLILTPRVRELNE
jgi:formate/nitrite transporter